VSDAGGAFLPRGAIMSLGELQDWTAVAGIATNDFEPVVVGRHPVLATHLETLRSHRGVNPALLLDDAFAELDEDRQRRLVRRLANDGTGQVFVTSPRRDELPAELAVPAWRMEGGKVLGAGDG